MGIQEINGVEISKPICKKSICLQAPINEKEFRELISTSWDNKPGPVFIELPLDVQAADDTFCSSQAIINSKQSVEKAKPLKNASSSTIEDVANKIKNSKTSFSNWWRNFC